MSERRELDAQALAAARSALASAHGKRRLDAIIDHPNPEALVRALPADELYLTIREVGLGDAAALVALASPAQFRTFLDLAAWKGDELAPRRALPWLRAARSGALDDARAAARWKAKLRAVDGELLDLVLRDALVVHEVSEDGEPPVAEGAHVMRTPDGKFLIEFRVDGAEYAAVRGLLDDLFAEDPFMAARHLSAIRWDLPSELEERALRWRAGRLADLGFPGREEALAWFTRPTGRPAPPAGIPARPPGFFLERLGQGSLLARAAARLAPEERRHVELELVTAANAVMVADAVDPGDLDATRAAVETARAFVEMGLQELAGPGPDAEARAAEVLANTAVRRLFQGGFGEVLALRWRAERIFKDGGAGTAAAPLLDAPLGEALTALARRRPLYLPDLELPRERWGSAEAAATEPRPFRSREEIARTRDALGLAEGLAELARDLGLDAPVTAHPEARLAARYLTALAQERLGGPFGLRPLREAQLEPAARALATVEDPRLASRGEAGALLATLARAANEELEPLRQGLPVPAAHLAALIVAAG